MIDLDRHNLVEASAGTGKTYRIEELVVRLLTERQLPLERILVVTFTEKATGELKTRLRDRLEKEAARETEQGAFLQKNLEDFDQAPIFTIHSFCQRLLREFPLEQGEEFVLELTSKTELLQPALREVQRLWPQRYGESLAELLRKAGYVGTEAKSWEEKVLSVAARYRPAWKHRLRPEPTAEPPEDRRALSTWLLVQTIEQMMQQVRRVQERRGLYTFDNLIERVAQALDANRNRSADLLLARLRQRFACAIVDEFQDTDPLQWQILRRIFVEGHGDGRLYIVGDPKQAIYGFTGADLPTYEQAKKELLESHDGKLVPLDVNWRSCADMVHGLNRLFTACDWFDGKKPGATKVYRSIEPCPADKARHVVETDETGRAVINLVDLRGRADKATGMRLQNARFVADEICRLLHRPECLHFRAKNKSRCLQPGDIAVLVRNRGEARPIARYLRRRGVPFTVYKDGGLWQSLEASQVRYALEALANPDDRRLFHRLLLTNFFRLATCDLLQNELPDRHPARVQFSDWVDLADQRAWGSLFASMVEDSFILQAHGDDAAEPSLEMDRTLANLRHILGVLQHAAYRDGMDVHGLVAFLRDRIRCDEGEDGYQPIETNESKVQILTMHTSKGLEFPIVFVAGGFTRSNPKLYEYREDQCKIIDLNPSASAKESYKEETAREDGRLLYVALTRAIFKLYVPLMGELRDSWAGPLLKLLQPSLTESKLAEGSFPGTRVISIEDKHVPSFRSQSATAAAETKGTLAGKIFPEVNENIFSRRIVLHSFSSLKRQFERAEQMSYGDFRERADDDDLGPLEEPDPLRGAEFGDLVHRILEELDWTQAAKVATAEEFWRDGTQARWLLEREMKITLPRIVTRMPRVSLEALCREKVGQMIWHALTTRLEPLDAPLCQLPAKDVLREIEFLFPGREGADDRTYLTGFMDVVFRKGGKYYLLDWKTNQLEGYDPVSLQMAMEETDYVRQYRLYSLALERWLRQVMGNAFSLDTHFGGVFYLFLRGMTGENGRDGVYFVQPEETELKVEAILTR